MIDQSCAGRRGPGIAGRILAAESRAEATWRTEAGKLTSAGRSLRFSNGVFEIRSPDRSCRGALEGETRRSETTPVLSGTPAGFCWTRISLHAVIYMVSADWFGSFGGDRLTALRIVAPTLARSALFQNISGVYLYATLASALPLYAAAIGRSHLCDGLPLRLRGPSGPVLAALGLFGLFAVLLTITAKLIMRLQSG